jgi:hypothetical protein
MNDVRKSTNLMKSCFSHLTFPTDIFYDVE